jgi:uncharacterized phiE125 gp8 family phage protein
MYRKDTFKVMELPPQQIWTLADVKNYMRIEGNYDDGLINSLIEAAIVAAENFTKMSIISRRVEFTCNIRNKQEFNLRYRPIAQLVKIIVMTKGEKSVLGSEQYSMDFDNASLLMNQKLDDEMLLVEYIAGFDQGSIPQSIRHGILMHVAEMYDRERQDTPFLSTEIKNLYLPYRQLKI